MNRSFLSLLLFLCVGVVAGDTGVLKVDEKKLACDVLDEDANAQFRRALVGASNGLNFHDFLEADSWCKMANMRKKFKKLDSNGDGVISREEWTAEDDRVQAERKASRLKSGKALFAEWDQNKDQSVDTAELLGFLISIGRNISAAAEFMDNYNNSMSLDEFQSFWADIPDSVFPLDGASPDAKKIKSIPKSVLDTLAAHPYAKATIDMADGTVVITDGNLTVSNLGPRSTDGVLNDEGSPGTGHTFEPVVFDGPVKETTSSDGYILPGNTEKDMGTWVPEIDSTDAYTDDGEANTTVPLPPVTAPTTRSDPPPAVTSVAVDGNVTFKPMIITLAGGDMPAATAPVTTSTLPPFTLNMTTTMPSMSASVFVQNTTANLLNLPTSPGPTAHFTIPTLPHFTLNLTTTTMPVTMPVTMASVVAVNTTVSPLNVPTVPVVEVTVPVSTSAAANNATTAASPANSTAETMPAASTGSALNLTVTDLTAKPPTVADTWVMITFGPMNRKK